MLTGSTRLNLEQTNLTLVQYFYFKLYGKLAIFFPVISKSLSFTNIKAGQTKIEIKPG